jgi:hypothetical protein
MPDDDPINLSTCIVLARVQFTCVCVLIARGCLVAIKVILCLATSISRANPSSSSAARLFVFRSMPSKSKFYFKTHFCIIKTAPKCDLASLIEREINNKKKTIFNWTNKRKKHTTIILPSDLWMQINIGAIFKTFSLNVRNVTYWFRWRSHRKKKKEAPFISSDANLRLCSYIVSAR